MVYFSMKLEQVMFPQYGWRYNLQAERQKEIIMSIKVHNINDTSDNTCSCGSWKQHWINQSGKSWPTYCSAIGCMKPAEVGAHVQRIKGSDKWYIIPMCTHHNNQRGCDADVSVNTIFVSANKAETCEKK